MAPYSIVKPSNRIEATDAPIRVKMVAGAGTVKPGLFVKRGADDNTCVITTGAVGERAIGLAGYTPDMQSPPDINTAYPQGSEVPVLMGPFIAKVWHDTSSETVTMGDNLMLSAAVPGGVCKATPLSYTSTGSTAINGTASTITIVGADPSMQVIAQALETVTFTGTAGWLLALVNVL